MPVIGDILKELRKDKGITQEALGKELGMKASTYSSYETGRRKVSIPLLEKLADILDTSTDYILGRTDHPEPYPPRGSSK